MRFARSIGLLAVAALAATGTARAEQVVKIGVAISLTGPAAV